STMYWGSTSNAVEKSFLILSGILDISLRLPSKYLRSLIITSSHKSMAATTTEKSTINQGSLNAVSAQAEQVPEVPHELGAPAPVPEACSLDDPDCEACQ
ncbi:hypothetical protein OAT59_02275, partial [Gammaproteobacteria bacterium]|nr:hypothetical protein [Gammaproteobacteria bacterium]